jgi:protein-tyrosine-phosphatase
MNVARPFRVLFLCTGNSARSQIAEALLARKGRGRFVVGSAGSHPAATINPLAVAVLGEHGIRWDGHKPKSVDQVAGERWDFVITVCDRAKEACPIFPGQPVFAHWGLPDPADAKGSREEKLRVFRETAAHLGRRIDLMLALPMEKLERAAHEERLRAIGEDSEAR